MSAGSAEFPVEPWHVREVGLDLSQLARTESMFALSNGHVGVRGNLDEGEPVGSAGTYLNSCFEEHPLSYAEGGYGYPESGQTVLNVTNGKLVRLLVGDEPFDLRYGRLLSHERVLDLRAGVLQRAVTWESPSGRVVRIRSTRLVSLGQRAILAIRYEVEPVGRSARVVVQSELMADEPAERSVADPEQRSALERPLESEEHSAEGHRSCLVHRTRRSGLRVAAAADHLIEGNRDTSVETVLRPDWSRTSVCAALEAGETLRLTKFVAYGWSARRSAAALRDQTEAALSTAVLTGWDQLLAEQRDYLDDFWANADVELEGDDEVQQAIRFDLFHVLQAGARAEQRPIPAKGLTGTGYSGHTFWDTETYVLPVLTATLPSAAADALRWRHSTLPLARKRAETLRLSGAAFPWRTIRGEECGAYWPAGTAALHVNADIAVAASRLVTWSGDEDFDRDTALDLLVETARLWMAWGYLGEDGKFHLDGVTGPDEYSAIVDDNTYTNLLAARNLRDAAHTARRWPDQASERGVDESETETWLRMAELMAVPYNQHGMPEQDRGSTSRQRWDFETSYRSHGYPLQDSYPYVDLYRRQVAKQADLVLALHWCGDRFSPEEKASAFAYYEELTVRDSSLSACSQAVIAAETGHLELAHGYLREAALMDLQDRAHNTGDGLHIASLAGAWIALVCGFGGLRQHDGTLRFAPRLPPALRSLSFCLRWRDSSIHIAVEQDRARYTLRGGSAASLELLHHGEPVTVHRGQPAELTIPSMPAPAKRPRQPPGRAPE